MIMAKLNSTHVRLSGLNSSGKRILSHSISDKVKVNETFRTNNYSIFKRLQGNRKLNMIHVKRLEESMKKNGMLEVDIIVNKNWEVIDGQNRLEAAKNTFSPVYFKIKPDYGLREAQILNENVKAWRKVDYMDSYCEMGSPEYIEFKKFMEDYKKDFNFTSCEALIRLKQSIKQETIGGETVSARYFQNGELKIADIQKSREYANAIKEIKPYFEGYNHSIFVRTMIFMLNHENYIHYEFKAKLQLRGAPKLDYCKTMAHYKLLIEDIYNYNRSKKVNLRY